MDEKRNAGHFPRIKPPVRRGRLGLSLDPDDLAPTLLPRHNRPFMTDSLEAAQAIIGASVGLAKAVEAMPGPLWAILNDRHEMEEHGLQRRGDCVPCQFDALLEAAHRHDGLRTQTRRKTDSAGFQDETLLFPSREQVAVAGAGWDANDTPPSFPHVAAEPKPLTDVHTEAELREAKSDAETQAFPMTASETVALPAQEDE